MRRSQQELQKQARRVQQKLEAANQKVRCLQAELMAIELQLEADIIAPPPEPLNRNLA